MCSNLRIKQNRNFSRRKRWPDDFDYDCKNQQVYVTLHFISHLYRVKLSFEYLLIYYFILYFILYFNPLFIYIKRMIYE